MFNFSKCNCVEGKFSPDDDNNNDNSNESTQPQRPNNNKKQHGIDSFTSWLYHLSPEERSKALNELHGIAEPIKETPEMLEEKFAQMNHIISSLIASSSSNDVINNTNYYNNNKNDDTNMKNKVAFQMAVTKFPEHVQSEKLRFLRAENYNCQKAVERLIRYIGVKRELFGDDSLGRDLTMKQDLKDIEKEALYAGLMQLLPQRDQAGRSVIILHGKVHSMYESNESVSRAILYFGSSVIRNDEETQLRGIVNMYYGLGQTKAHPGRISMFIKVFESLPWRNNAIHYCKDSLVLETALRVMSKFMERSTLCRIRIHIGTPVEVSYNLMTYGIPREALPFNDDGTMNLEQQHRILNTLQYMEEQRQLQLQQRQHQYTNTTTTTINTPDVTFLNNDEANDNNTDNNNTVNNNTDNNNTDNNNTDNIDNNHKGQSDNNTSVLEENDNDQEKQQPQSLKVTTTSIILVPGPMDVLLGRGRHVKNRPGSYRLHHLLDTHVEAYEAASKFQKMNVARIVLKEMKDSGCRFLTLATAAVGGGGSGSNGGGGGGSVGGGGGYVECDDEAALNKISHGFRNLRMRGSCVSRAKEKKARNESFTSSYSTVSSSMKRTFPGEG